MSIDITVCSECGKADELRPYGENFALICHACGMKNKARTEKNFIALLDGASAEDVDGMAVIGTEHGPQPLEKADLSSLAHVDMKDIEIRVLAAGGSQKPTTGRLYEKVHKHDDIPNTASMLPIFMAC